MKTPSPMCVADNEIVFLSNGINPGIYGKVY
jgi:hypothetical protein